MLFFRAALQLTERLEEAISLSTDVWIIFRSDLVYSVLYDLCYSSNNAVLGDYRNQRQTLLISTSAF